MRIILTEEFETQYARLSKNIKLKAEKQQNIFKDNPFYPSLHTENWLLSLKRCGVFVLIESIELFLSLRAEIRFIF